MVIVQPARTRLPNRLVILDLKRQCSDREVWGSVDMRTLAQGELQRKIQPPAVVNQQSGLTSYEPGGMQAGMGQFRCLTVLPGS